MSIAGPNQKIRRFMTAAVFVIALAGAPIADALSTQGKIYPGVIAGAIDIGGLTIKQAQEKLENELNKFLNSSTVLLFENNQTTIPAKELIEFNIDAVIKKAAAIGNTGNLVQKAKERLESRFSKQPIDLDININEDNINSIVSESFLENETQPQNAKFSFAFENNKTTIGIEPGKNGKTIDTDSIINSLKNRVSTFDNSPIELSAKDSPPIVNEKDLENLMPEINKIFAYPEPVITALDKKWTIKYQDLSSWITAEKTKIGIDDKKVAEWLNKTASSIEKAPVDSIFEIDLENNKVKTFSIGEQGIELPRKENVNIIKESILNGKPAVLTTRTIAPKIKDNKEAEEYGIKELVGKGTTNFVGSPVNRKKNIARGAAILYGELIPNGEEFALLKYLKPFTAENGYLSELVIKAAQGKTVPEIGGGLCQIGTTMFRAALDAGLPITARVNHSYRVSYYEPPVGMDATIYDPWPDFKFINDTGNWLLLTTRIKGTEITFELWGTKDGRKVSMTEPEVYNFVKPPAKKIIKTLDLLPGKTKCTEHAHTGSDAKFTYTVAYQNGEEKSTEFFSHYRPWQEVCLLGVKPEEMVDVIEDIGTLTIPNAETLPSADALGTTGN